MFSKQPLFSFFIVFLTVCFAFSALSLHLFENSAYSPAVSTPQNKPVIVIDAGHGGIDGGATGADGTPEKDLNLAISKRLALFFCVAGYTVVQTRTDDRSLADADAKKGHVKQSDLVNRLKISNQYPGSVLISIHMNTYPGVTCRGLQVWYSENNATSKELASAVQSGVKGLLQPENNRKIKASTSSIYLLRHAENPAILIECGFISNEEECERLSTELYQRELTLAIFAALHQKMQNSTCENGKNMLYY